MEFSVHDMNATSRRARDQVQKVRDEVNKFDEFDFAETWAQLSGSSARLGRWASTSRRSAQSM